MIKLIIKYLLLGIVWGCVVFSANVLLLDVTGSPQLQDVFDRPTVHILSFIVVCIGLFGGGIVYKIERLGLALKLAIHVTVGIGLYMLIGFNIGWFDLENPSVITFGIALNMLILVAVWTVNYFRDKRKVETINRRIRERNSEKTFDTEQ